jgi:hypothetical protein
MSAEVLERDGACQLTLARRHDREGADRHAPYGIR